MRLERSQYGDALKAHVPLVQRLGMSSPGKGPVPGSGASGSPGKGGPVPRIDATGHGADRQGSQPELDTSVFMELVYPLHRGFYTPQRYI